MYILILFLYLLSVSVKGNIFNPNSTDLSKCKVHYSRPESQYKEFYSLLETPEKNETLVLDFHFAVLAPSDAHILLAPAASVKKEDPAYEIVIGAGGNSFSDIRRKQKSAVKASYRGTGLLSALDPRFFWIHIAKDGAIEVGKEGEELAFVSWIDPDPLPIKFVSFSTWSGIEAKWYFFCERINETEEIEIPLSTTRKLMNDLLYHYDPYVRPVMDYTTITIVMIALQINHIELNEHKSSIHLISQLKMAWHDEKLKWDPMEYDDIDHLRIISSEIWKPELIVYNDNQNGHNIDEDSIALVHSNGLIEWNSVFYINAWCDVEDLGVWPKDKHKCTLLFGIGRDYNHINIEFVKNESSLVTHRSSKWTVLEADMMSGKFLNDQWSPPILTLTLVLQRQSNLYNTIFFTPFLIISVCVLLSFWTDPFGHLKISLICAQLILASLLLLTLGIFAPNHSKHVPHLVTLYSYSMVAILAALIISIIVINVSRKKNGKPAPHILCAVLTSNVLKFGLILPKINMSEEYGKLNDIATKSQEKGHLMWIQLGFAIDRIAFLLYLGLTIYVIYSFY